MRRTFRNDRAERSYPNPWGAQTGTAYRVLCSDGKIRTAVATAEADTFYTIPARVTVRGRTITGSVYHRGMDWDGPADGPRYAFSAYTYRKNGAILPRWPEATRP